MEHQLSIIESTFATSERTIPGEIFAGLWQFRGARHLRGTVSPIVEVDGTGKLQSPPGWLEQSVLWRGEHRASLGHPLLETLGFRPGIDYLRTHEMQLIFTSGLPFSPRPHLYPTLNVWDRGVVVEAERPASVNYAHWSNASDKIMYVEPVVDRRERGIKISDAIQVLDVASGQVTTIGALAKSTNFGNLYNSLRWSPGDRYVLFHSEFAGCAAILDVASGELRALSIRCRALDWDRENPGCLVGIVGSDDHERCEVFHQNIVTGERTVRSSIAWNSERPSWFRSMRSSADGRYGVTIAPLGCTPGHQTNVRGGKGVACIVDLHTGTTEVPLDAVLGNGMERGHDSVDWKLPVSQGRDGELDLRGFSAFEFVSQAEFADALASVESRREEATLAAEKSFAYAFLGGNNDVAEMYAAKAAKLDPEVAASVRRELDEEYSSIESFRPLSHVPIDHAKLTAAVEQAAEGVLTATRFSELGGAIQPLAEFARPFPQFWGIAATVALEPACARSTLLLLAAILLQWSDVKSKPELVSLLALPSRAEALHLFTSAAVSVGDVDPNMILGVDGSGPLTPPRLGGRISEKTRSMLAMSTSPF